jgi:1-acyl-sn-glycerol-3-phosphate acyltransferase
MIVLRSIFFYLWFFLSMVITAVALWVVPKISRFTPWDIVRIWSQGLNEALRILCRVRVEVYGTAPDDLESTLIVSNHTGPWETVALQPFFKHPIIYVVKKQLLEWRYHFFALGIRTLKPIPIARTNNAGDLERILKDSQEHFKQKRQVLIFPEGTRQAAEQCVSMNAGGALLAKRLKCRLQVLFVNSESWSCGTILKDFGVISPGVIRLYFGPLFTSHEIKEEKIKTLQEKTLLFFKQCLKEDGLGL